jgi:dihydrodipicolinate synthase/N-acetylneuraminate lyase
MQITSVIQRTTPGRTIEGNSAVLLPYLDNGSIDFDGLAANISRTVAAGLRPAVNMDTGYTNLITAAQRTKVVDVARQATRGAGFIAGAFIEGSPGEPLALYQRAVAEIEEYGGTPILFQCSPMKAMTPDDVIAIYKGVGAACSSFLAFELGEMFASFGQIYDLATVRELMEIPQIKGMKHSSLSRVLEWQRQQLRDEVRPDFKIYTGNDLAIDLVCTGSDYLLGLSAFSPEAFAARDKMWRDGDARFYELNDLLQYLGFFAFRAPVPAYKHTCAQFLKLRGRIQCDNAPAGAARRPAGDLEILRDISSRLDAFLSD